ncbi:ATP-binding protein [Pandoraea norimbergensis]|uniref:ATP-binding protein n=1 Tax=Pandoraea norimbergensis TaxID=93219 RepID=UPI003899306E
MNQKVWRIRAGTSQRIDKRNSNRLWRHVKNVQHEFGSDQEVPLQSRFERNRSLPPKHIDARYASPRWADSAGLSDRHGIASIIVHRASSRSKYGDFVAGNFTNDYAKCRPQAHQVASISTSYSGAVPRPGEISLAHRGVLFLDEPHLRLLSQRLSVGL